MLSCAKQYKLLPSAQEELHFREWLMLVSGLMEDTPLGQVVMIRKETDRRRLKGFTRHEHRVRSEWQRYRAAQKRASAPAEEYAVMFEKMFSDM